MFFRKAYFLALLFALTTSPLLAQKVPQRIISLSPNLTEMIYDIGAQDQLVGDTDYCNFPAAAQKKERIGGWIDPNFEKIISLKPDLVIALKFHDNAINTLKKLHIPVAVINCDSVKDILKSYDVLGKLVGHEAQAKAARAALEKRLAKIKQRAKGKKVLSVLFVVGRTPGTMKEIYGVGKKNFINELINMAGGINVLEDAMTDYPLVSKEELIQRNPDVIIDSTLSHDIKDRKEEMANSPWGQMAVLKAVQNKQVYYCLTAEFLIPGPSMVGLGEFLCDHFEKARTSR